MAAIYRTVDSIQMEGRAGRRGHGDGSIPVVLRQLIILLLADDDGNIEPFSGFDLVPVFAPFLTARRRSCRYRFVTLMANQTTK